MQGRVFGLGAQKKNGGAVTPSAEWAWGTVQRLRTQRWAVALALMGGCGDEGATGESDADTDSMEDPAEDPGLQDPGAPPPAGLKKVRSWEYRNLMEQLFEGPIAISRPLPPDAVRASFSSVSAAADCYDPTDVEGLELVALDVAAQAFAQTPTPLQAMGCEPSSASDTCVRDFIADFGRRAWRRPLTAAELSKYDGLAQSLAALYDGDPIKGAELTVAAMLQSPYFVYRVELGTPLEVDPGVRKYDGYEMASRLAFVLWERGPDQALLDAAAAGELTTEASVREHALRMLDDPKSIDAVFRFWREHLSIDRLTLTNYPRAEATPSLYAAMREEGHFMAYQLAQPGADALSFLDADTAYLQPELARVYGIELGEEGEVSLDPTRAGFLTSGLFLVSNGHPGKTSPTRRGKFVLERVLCRTIPPPPANVDLTLPDAAPGEATRRELVEMHATEPACKACHVLLDPPGFAFEHYGPMGGFRQEDNGLAIDASGELDAQPFRDAPELVALLRDNPDAARCVVTQTYRAVQGTVEEDAEEPYIDALTTAFVEGGHDQRLMIADLVASEAFRFATGQRGGE